MGTRNYAEAVSKLLDPEGRYFAHRMISKYLLYRDDAPNEIYKSLKKLLPFDDSMAVILDDTFEVWPNCDNLVLARRFIFFKDRVDPIEDKFSGDNDMLLFFISELLIEIHEEFYKSDVRDIKILLHEKRTQLLRGINIAFSGLIPLNENCHASELWQLATLFGANCREDLSEDVTHLLALREGTKKTKKAKKRGIPVLHSSWLVLSTAYWRLLPEAPFMLSHINSLDVRALLPVRLKRRISSPELETCKKLKTETESSSSDSDFNDL